MSITSSAPEPEGIPQAAGWYREDLLPDWDLEEPGRGYTPPYEEDARNSDGRSESQPLDSSGKMSRKASAAFVVAMLATGFSTGAYLEHREEGPGPTHCEAITPSIRQEAQRILDQANAGYRDGSFRRSSFIPDPLEKTLQHIVRPAEIQAREEAAQKNGVTILSPAAYQRRFTTGKGYIRTDIPTSTYLTAANNLIRPYGAIIDTAIPEGEAYDGKRKATARELEAPTTKKNIYNIVDAITSIPEEAIVASGLKRIHLFYMPPEKARKPLTGTVDVKAYVHTRRPDTIYYNASVESEPDIFFHEWSHTRDCELDEDKTYTAANHGEAYGQGAPYTLAQYEADYMQAKNEIYTTYPPDSGQPNRRCSIAEDLLKKSNETRWVSDYSNTNITEDKGEMGKAIAQPNEWRRMLDGRNPDLTAKFTTLYTRLLARYPHTARYFAELAPRSQSVYRSDMQAVTKRDCKPYQPHKPR